MVDIHKIYLENFIYVDDHLLQILPVLKDKIILVGMDYYDDDGYPEVDLHLSYERGGELLNVRQEFLYACKVKNEGVINSVLDHLQCYLLSQGVTVVIIKPFSFE